MRIIIIGGGAFKNTFSVREDDYVICADHGYDHALKKGIHVNLVIGDMDSVQSDTSNAPEKLILPVRKDFTDSETAVRHAIDMNPDEIVLLGFTGTRLDHTMANIFLLRLIYNAGIRGFIDEGNNRIYYFGGSFSVENKEGFTVSLIPLTESIDGITTYGLDYPLNDESLYFGETRGISNVITESPAGYTANSGEGIIVLTKADV